MRKEVLKTIRLEGDVLELVKRHQASEQERRAKGAAAEAEYKAKIDALNDQGETRNQLFWRHLEEAVPAIAQGEWCIDAAYLQEQGVAFLNQVAAADEDEDADDVPPALQAMAEQIGAKLGADSVTVASIPIKSKAGQPDLHDLFAAVSDLKAVMTLKKLLQEKGRSK